MVWVVCKLDGEYHRAPNGLPLYASSKREARELARQYNVREYVLKRIID